MGGGGGTYWVNYGGTLVITSTTSVIRSYDHGDGWAIDFACLA